MGDLALMKLLEHEGIRDSRVLGAVGALDRASFIPPEHRSHATGNYPVPIGFEQTISQPYVVAYMTEALELQERLMSVQHERDMEIIRAQQSDKRTDFLKEKLDMLAPVLVSKMIGKGAGGAALGEELMRQFLKSLTPDQMSKIVGSLAPEQAAVINEIYLAYGERELAQETGKKSANGKKTNGHTNGTAGH